MSTTTATTGICLPCGSCRYSYGVTIFIHATITASIVATNSIIAIHSSNSTATTATGIDSSGIPTPGSCCSPLAGSTFSLIGPGYCCSIGSIPAVSPTITSRLNIVLECWCTSLRLHLARLLLSITHFRFALPATSHQFQIYSTVN